MNAREQAQHQLSKIRLTRLIARIENDDYKVTERTEAIFICTISDTFMSKLKACGRAELKSWCEAHRKYINS